MEWPGNDRFGLARFNFPGHGKVWCGAVRTGGDWLGLAWQCMAWFNFHWHGRARIGRAWSGRDWKGPVRHGRVGQGLISRGLAWYDSPLYGVEWTGDVVPVQARTGKTNQSGLQVLIVCKLLLVERNSYIKETKISFI